MQHKHHIKHAIVTSLFVGITLITEGSIGHLQGQLSASGGGALVLPPADERVVSISQGPTHGAAPIATDAGAFSQLTLLLGMALVLAGFVMSYHLVRSEERPVHITVKNRNNRQRLALSAHPHVGDRFFWIRLDI